MFDKDTEWQTKTFCDRNKLSVTNTDCLWQNRLSVTDRDCLWQSQNVCDRHRLFVTHTDCIWHIQTVCDIGLFSVTEAKTITTDIFNIDKCVNIWKLCIYYFHTKNKALRFNSVFSLFLCALDWNWFMHFHGQFIGKITASDTQTWKMSPSTPSRMVSNLAGFG